MYRRDVKGIFHRRDLDDDKLEAVWIETRRNGKSLIIGCIYIPPPEDQPEALLALDRILHFLGPEQSIIITGDPNSRNLAWEHWHHTPPQQNYYAWKRGNWLLNLADKHNLTIANSGNFTRRVGDTKSAPDVTLVRNLPDLRWQVDQSINLGSDHLAIVLSLQTPPQKSQRRWNIRKAEWPKWKVNTRQAFSNFPEEAKNLTPNRTMVKLVDGIVDTADSTLETRTICSHSKGFFTPELKMLQDNVRHARKKFKVRSDSFNQLAVEKAVEEYTRLYNQAKSDHHIELCKALNTKDSKLWPKVNRIKSGIKAAIQPLKCKVDGKDTVEFEDSGINRVLIDHHIRPPPEVDCDKEWRDHVNQLVPRILADEYFRPQSTDDLYYNAAITIQETDSAIDAMNPLAAPGPDRILPILVQKADYNLNIAVHHSIKVAFDEGVFPDINKRENRTYLAKDLKEDYNVSKAYRSISLSSCLGKAHERILGNRLVGFMDRNGLWDAHQYAYRKNRSLVQCLMFYVLSVLFARHEGKYCATTFIDSGITATSEHVRGQNRGQKMEFRGH